MYNMVLQAVVFLIFLSLQYYVVYMFLIYFRGNCLELNYLGMRYGVQILDAYILHSRHFLPYYNKILVKYFMQVGAHFISSQEACLDEKLHGAVECCS